MQKDVVYIDVEDDITAIIGKLKASKHKIIALVPPKRIGVLQSAVNLRLLARAAEQNEKRLVIITANHALSGLAASAAIPVAKNLQSKPEIAEIAALDIDDGEDIIDGAALPIGEHAKQAGEPESDVVSGDTVVPASLATAAAVKSTKKPNKKGSKVPNFDTFRKKLVIGGVAGVLLISFLVWAIVFAPHAKVILLARTTDASVSQQVQLSTTAESSAANTILKVEQKETTKDVSVPFNATGEKDVGEKANGTIDLSTNSNSSQTIPAGTKLTTDAGQVFEVANAILVPAATLSFSCGGICPGEATGTVVATDSGPSYNGATGSLTGGPSGVSISLQNATAGGTSKIVKTVKQSDIDAAKKDVDSKIDKEQLKKDLASQFGDSYQVLDDTFTVETKDLKSSPGVNAEAPDGKATYGGRVKASIMAVSKDELGNYLDAVLEQQMDDAEEQRVYENGADTAEFSNVVRDDDKITINLKADGKIGPRIDEEKIKTLAAGKSYGEIQEALTSINGIAEADVKFSPFWVSKAPNDTSKISIEFKVDE